MGNEILNNPKSIFKRLPDGKIVVRDYNNKFKFDNYAHC